MSNPTVTGIVATRDRPTLLRRAIRSMLDQDTDALIEIVAVFDRSEPDLSLVNEFPEVRIKVIANTRTPGLCGARNSGILEASGDWVAFCDDDDEWTSDKLSRQLDVIGQNSEMVVGGIHIDNETRIVTRVPGARTVPLSRLVKSRVMEAHSSTFLLSRQALLGPLGLIDEKIPGGYYEDYDILLRAAQRRPIEVADAPVATIHWHRSSFFKNRWEMSIEAIDYLFAKFPELGSSRRGAARLRGQQAFAMAGLGRAGDALKMSGRTWLLDPTQLRSYISAGVALTPIKAEWLVRLVNSVGRGL